MNMFNAKKERPDKMISVKYIKQRLENMGYSPHKNMLTLHDLGPFADLREEGACEAVAALYKILDEANCYNCGRIINGGEKFCPNCGSKVRD